MAVHAVRLANADKMIAFAAPDKNGIQIGFADGCRGTIPFSDLPEIGKLANLKHIDLPNAYEVILHNGTGDTIEIPWDFARPYCDDSYRSRVEDVDARGRRTIGGRIRDLRHASHMTQEQLASAAGIGRVTLVRIEHGGQSPRHETLLALAKAMNREPAKLLT